jgi:hypothetical protein
LPPCELSYALLRPCFLVVPAYVSVQVELQVTSIRVVSRAAALPFELVDAARSDVSGERQPQQGQKQQ